MKNVVGEASLTPGNWALEAELAVKDLRDEVDAVEEVLEPAERDVPRYSPNNQGLALLQGQGGRIIMILH